MKEGYPADAILAAAREEKAGLIAMTTHGRSGIARFTMGSVAERVVRASDVPVLLLRSFPDGSTPAGGGTTSFARILVPVDGSDRSLAVLDPVIELAKLYGSKVFVAWVDESVLYPALAYADGAEPSVPPAATAQDVLRPAEEILSRAGVPHATITAAGDASLHLLKFAEARSADLIAMATHGRSGFTRWVFGSVTEKVLRAAACPMLVVRGAGTTVLL
jgi:nucleotide-binding universal stress UspA family protein